MLLRVAKKLLTLFGYRESPLKPEIYSLMEGLKRGSYGPGAGYQEEGFVKLEKRVKDLEGIRIESPRTKKMKERIKRLLRQHERLTADQLSTIIQLSRTRCNEYLKGLERDNLVTWFDEGKRRYYRILEELPEAPEAINA